MKNIVRHNDLTIEYNIGGKARNLKTMCDNGFKVPEWICLSEEFFMDCIGKSIQSESNLETIKNAIAQFTFSDSQKEEILKAIPAASFYAVRSSVADEDGSEFSFAGQFNSYLFVTKEELFENIKLVWLSAFSERVLEYRKTNGLQINKGIAVIIQRMINADVSGVGFGMNPINGNRKQKLISAVYGLGEGLVSGELNADTYKVLESKIETEIAEKIKKVSWNTKAGKGTELVAVSNELQNKTCLNDSQILHISNVLEELFSLTGKFQDIEFCFENNEFYLLQTRPITTHFNISDISADRVVWDNSNIIESYPGITSPLTFSFISKVYEAAYLQFMHIMGVDESVIDKNSNVFPNMLGVVRGRVYYNLRNWYKLIRMLPGYSLNAEFMEKMMGVKEKFELNETEEKTTKLKGYISLLKMANSMRKNHRQLRQARIDFMSHFDTVMDELELVNLDTYRPDELMHLYFELEKDLLRKWKPPLVNDFFAMIYFGMLQKEVTKNKMDETGNLHNNLMCGAKDIVSTEPITRINKIVKIVNEDKAIAHYFLSTPSINIVKELKEGKHALIGNEINAYIRKFGDRYVGELKLETETYKQHPHKFVDVIKSYIGKQFISVGNDIEMQLRNEAEQIVEQKLKGKFFKKRKFKFILRKSREMVSNRENLRFYRTRAFGIVRRIFNGIGKQFFAEGVIDNPRDIYFLTKDEIFNFIEGKSTQLKLKELITIRKKEYAEYEKEEILPERFTTYGTVYYANSFKSSSHETNFKGDLKGIGCCPGIITAKVRVVNNPDEVKNLEGDILVTSSTDPGWVTLFPSASGILVERGSLLSHSAIVSREMGIPCVVSITGLLKRLKTGDTVQMNGSTGEIKIIE